jgi:hypothetical protein
MVHFLQSKNKEFQLKIYPCGNGPQQKKLQPILDKRQLDFEWVLNGDGSSKKEQKPKKEKKKK